MAIGWLGNTGAHREIRASMPWEGGGVISGMAGKTRWRRPRL